MKFSPDKKSTSVPSSCPEKEIEHQHEFKSFEEEMSIQTPSKIEQGIFEDKEI